MPVNTNRQSDSAKVPYWRLSGFYFWYFALLGALYPYWPLYLQEKGFGPDEIGLLLAVPLATKLFAPNICGWIGDRSDNRMRIVRRGSFLATISFSGLFLSGSYWWLLLVFFFYSSFWNGVLSQYEVVTLRFLGNNSERYSRIRLWGSIGFIAAVMGAGFFFETHSIELLIVAGLGLLSMIWVSSLVVPTPPLATMDEEHHRAKGAFWSPAIFAFLGAGFLLQLAHGAYYSFFSIYLENYGYSRGSIGALWAVGVLAEIFIFLIMHNLLLRFSLRHIMLFSLLIAAFRWYLIGHFAHWLEVLLIAQVGHAFTFGTFHASAIESVRRLFGPHRQGMGQALYSATSFGAGGACGSYLAGQVWDFGPVYAFDMASLVCLLAVLLVAGWLKDQRLSR